MVSPVFFTPFKKGIFHSRCRIRKGRKTSFLNSNPWDCRGKGYPAECVGLCFPNPFRCCYNQEETGSPDQYQGEIHIRLKIERYMEQMERWPAEGRHILAQYDPSSIVVYQAYKPKIGRFAVDHGYFGGEFRFNRMSWIKPNFLWMMFRSGWGTKPDQETILAIHIERSGFDSLLEQAVHSTWNQSLHPDREAWQKDLRKSEVRLQWDPDHDPFGQPVKRRAVQLGLRGETLIRYARDWIVEIEDITNFVKKQKAYVDQGKLDRLETPQETVYPPASVQGRV